MGRFHTTAEMDSLRIKDRRTWFRYSQNTGGDAITFLQQFCGKSFSEAVEYLLAFHGRARDSPTKAAPFVKRDEVQKHFIIVKLAYAKGKSRVLVYAVPAGDDLPEVLKWEDSYLSSKSFVLVLGESYTGPVTVNLAHIPHILLGGSTGSGKSVLLKLLLMQALHKDAEDYIADFKGGVDYPKVWHEKCRMCFTEEDLLYTLNAIK